MMKVLQFLKNPDEKIYLKHDNYLVLDFETTNIDYGNPVNPDNQLVMASYWYKDELHSIVGNEYDMSDLVDLIESVDFVVAQNVKFEAGWLIRCGANLDNIIFYDTYLGAYIRAGNRVWIKKDLDSICARYGVSFKNHLVKFLIKAGVCPSQIPLMWLVPYCEKDVDITRDVFLKQVTDLEKRGLLKVMLLRCLFTPVLADIESRGICVDPKLVKKEFIKTQKELAKTISELESVSGEKINWNSSPQKADLVYGKLKFKELRDRRGRPIRNKPSKKFPDGAPKTDGDTLLALKAETKVQEEFVGLLKSQSKLQQKLSTYLTPFMRAVEEHDGMLYSTFNQAVTQTHRLSSSNPNFQNFDRTLKKVFTSRYRDKGWKMVDGDEGQLEFRAAILLSGDEQGIKDIADPDFDSHVFSAAIILDRELESYKKGMVTEEERQMGKPHTFKPLYGGESGTEREVAYYKAFAKRYPKLRALQDQWVKDAINTKRQETLSGLVYYWPYIKMSQTGYVEGHTKVRNYPIQAFATADIVPIAVTFLWAMMKEENMESFIVNVVHDDALAEVSPDEIELFSELLVQSFTTLVTKFFNQLYEFEFCVPLEADVTVGTHWGGDY